MMEMVVTTGAVRVQSSYFFHQQTNTQLSTGRMSAVLSMLQLLLQHFGDFSISVGICNTFFTVSIAKNTGGQKAS